MKIFIDIGHPAHVHYFRNFIKIMESKGHKIFVCARDKEVTHTLLNYYQIKYTSRGKGRTSLLGKIFYIMEADFKIFRLAKIFKPDIFLSFASPYLAHISWLLRKPHIAFDDTEHARFEHLMYIPFTKVILTPSCFHKNLGSNQLFFNGYMELCALHKNYFIPDINIKSKLGLNSNEKYIVIRFVSWRANHDFRQYGLKNETKQKIVDHLKTEYKIFISSESELPSNLEKYKLKVHPAELHSVLAGAYLCICEGSTTSSECSILGKPNIYINSLTVGYVKEQAEIYGLCFQMKDDTEILEVIKNILRKNNLESEWEIKKEKMLNDKIDVTAFMVWFIENYPQSLEIMKKNPEYQNKFK